MYMTVLSQTLILNSKMTQRAGVKLRQVNRKFVATLNRDSAITYKHHIP